MSLIRVHLDYDSNLWIEDWEYRSRNKYDGVTVDITPVGIYLSLDIELSKEDKIGIAKGLHNSVAPHWQNIPVAQRQTLIDISLAIYSAADRVDMALRTIKKCYRLPAPTFTKFYLNQQPHCDVMTWVLDDVDKDDLKDILSEEQKNDRVVRDKSITLPFPINYDRKQIHLDSDEVKIFEKRVDDVMVIPYKQMYAEAYARFTAGQYDTTVLLLATSVETALKSYISEKGGELTQFMLDKMASPMLENLFVAAVDYCGMTAPSGFKKWLANLRVHRNSIAHKPTSSCVDPLEVGRWVAVVEGLMSAIDGETIDVNVGKVVQPVGPKAVEKFTADTVGVILRSEPYLDMPPYHVLMTTGETYRMNNSSFKIIDKYKFKTPNN